MREEEKSLHILTVSQVSAVWSRQRRPQSPHNLVGEGIDGCQMLVAMLGPAKGNTEADATKIGVRLVAGAIAVDAGHLDSLFMPGEIAADTKQSKLPLAECQELF